MLKLTHIGRSDCQSLAMPIVLKTGKILRKFTSSIVKGFVLKYYSIENIAILIILVSFITFICYVTTTFFRNTPI